MRQIMSLLFLACDKIPLMDYNQIHRFALILERLKHYDFPKKKVLLDYINRYGKEVSMRTLERDIARIEEEFGVVIENHPKEKGVYIDRESSFGLDNFARYLQLVSTARLLKEGVQNPDDLMEYIDFEEKDRLEGSELLEPLLNAIRKKLWIEFNHVNFLYETVKFYRVMPQMLKEYKNRWYLVALTEQKQFRTLGVDRIKDLEVSVETFNYQPGQNPKDLFRRIVGLDYSAEKVEHILLSVEPLHARYLKSLPLHHTQKVEKETDEEVLIRLHVKPNFELKQNLLAMGDKMEVLEPESLRLELRETIARMHSYYQK